MAKIDFQNQKLFNHTIQEAPLRFKLKYIFRRCLILCQDIRSGQDQFFLFIVRFSVSKFKVGKIYNR